ncbi:MAG: NADH-ubiquinone oxidoreductase-F iron-sulfur binding region domain-containing protein, partial [Candidatus Nanopelagicales bacterium]
CGQCTPCREGTQWRDKATVRPTGRGSYRFAVQVPRSAPAGRTYEWRVVATQGRTVVATSQIRSSLVR